MEPSTPAPDAQCADITPGVVSVVMACRNYARFLPGAFAALAAQRLDPARLELVFVDDASSDGSLALAQKLLPETGLGSWKAVGLPHQGRPGPVRNHGFALAKGEFLLALDPDDLILPDFLPRCLQALEGPGADVAYTAWRDEEGGQGGVVLPPEYGPLLLANQNLFSVTALFRRSLWDAGARFRRSTGYEDWDFWVQAALLGARFARVPEPLFVYRRHPGGFSTQARLEDGLAKARIVLDNPAFFPAWTRAWARGLMRGDSWAAPGPRGIIPVLREHTGLPGQARRASGLPAPAAAAAQTRI